MAELTSGVGAVVLGIGLGVLLSGPLSGWGVPLLLLGILVHGWGMYDKHCLERAANAPEVWWETALFWLCWVLLAVGVLAAAGRVLHFT